MNITIRPAAIADGAAIYALNRDSLGYEYDCAKTCARLAYILGTADTVLVAVCDGVVVGYIHGAPYECTYSDSLKNILALAVGPAWQGRGIGRRLIKALEAAARADGCIGVRLVSSINRAGAHSFYRACGYAHRKDQRNFIKLF